MFRPRQYIYKDYIYIDDDKKIKLSRDDFIRNNFITTNDKNDKLFSDDISKILIDNNFLIGTCATSRIMNKMNIGKYNKQCNINKCIKGGFEFIKYTGKIEKKNDLRFL